MRIPHYPTPYQTIGLWKGGWQVALDARGGCQRRVAVVLALLDPVDRPRKASPESVQFSSVIGSCHFVPVVGADLRCGQGGRKIIVVGMAGPSGPGSQWLRPAAVAGMFYPANPQECRAQAMSYVAMSPGTPEPARRWFGGVVPHAGWICSGAIAGQTIAAIARAMPRVDLVVVFGAIHTPIPTHVAALDSFGSWDLPGERFEVPDELRRRVGESAEGLFVVDDRFHRREHAIEVELPLIRSAWPSAAVLPVEVPPDDCAPEIGVAVARTVQRMQSGSPPSAVYLASSDLTHYGPAYGFAPSGVGERAMQWARANDRSLIDRILELRAETIVPEVREKLNACGAGAIAAMLAACKEAGAVEACLLRHANSFETLAAVTPQKPDNAVGYASIVIG